MFNIRGNLKKMVKLEEKGIQRSRLTTHAADPQTREEAGGSSNGKSRVAILFLILVLGILASWFWEIGWQYIAEPQNGLQFGPLPAFLVRVVLAFIIAAITFLSAYGQINKPSAESWVAYFVAFQSGFFWDAIFRSVTASFTSGG